MKIFKRIKIHFKNISYKRHLSSLGENAKFYPNTTITYPENVTIGSHFIMHSGCVIASKDKVKIGNYVTMSRGSQILTEGLNTNIWACEGYKKHLHISKPVEINDGTWLCVNAIVLPGVSLKGKGIIVAAGAVVTKSFSENYVILAGVPAKIVKRLAK